MSSKKSIYADIGRQLKTARERNHLTQEQFSELLDVTPHFLSSVERGISGLSLEKFRLACILLHVSSDFLLFGKEDSDFPDVAALSQEQQRILQQIVNDCLRLSRLIDA